MENILSLLLGQNAFGGPGGPGGLGEAPLPGQGGGLLDKLKGAAGTMQAIQPPQGTKPVFSGGVSGVSQPFLQKQEDMITPMLNGMRARQGQASTLPTMAQLLAGR